MRAPHDVVNWAASAAANALAPAHAEECTIMNYIRCTDDADDDVDYEAAGSPA